MTAIDQKIIKAVAGEFLCTFIFIFSVCANILSMNGNDNSGGNVTNASICTGFTAIAIIFAFGAISGAHFNPAVTLGAIIGKKIDPVQGVLYIVVQLISSVLAVFSLYAFYDDVSDLSFEVPTDGGIKATMMEMLLTFILVFVVFTTAFKYSPSVKKVPSDGEEGAEQEQIGTPSGSLLHKSLEGSPNSNVADVESQNSSTTESDELKDRQSTDTKLALSPIPIGLTLGFLCFLDGGFSGGYFNPARAFGPAVVNSIVGGTSCWSSFLCYVVGDFGGAALAAIVFTALF